jgi:phosphate transport system permease protein
VQVYSWASRADPAFVDRSAGAIIVLLLFLLVMNAVAILLRRRFERRW